MLSETFNKPFYFSVNKGDRKLTVLVVPQESTVKEK